VLAAFLPPDLANHKETTFHSTCFNFITFIEQIYHSVAALHSTLPLLGVCYETCIMASKLDFLLRARSDFFSCLEQRIKKVFDASATPSQPPPPLHQPQGTAALLDPSTLKKLLLPVFEHDIEISQSHASVSSTQCNVVYHVVKSTNSDRNEWMSVEFTRCSDSHAAEANMRNHLGTFARDVSEVHRLPFIANSWEGWVCILGPRYNICRGI